MHLSSKGHELIDRDILLCQWHMASVTPDWYGLVTEARMWMNDLPRVAARKHSCQQPSLLIAILASSPLSCH